MLRQGLAGNEVFNQLDDLETLPGSEFQERTKQTQALDGVGGGRAEPKMQFSSKTGVLHLATTA
jgi:hypothetical protein